MAETPWTTPQTIGARTSTELEQLARDVENPERVTIFCSDEAPAAEGITATARWLLGLRTTAPVSREVYDRPLTGQSIGREAARADDAIHGRGPATDLHEDYAAGVRHTLWWVQAKTGFDRPA